jgi:hypothetical protein
VSIPEGRVYGPLSARLGVACSAMGIALGADDRRGGRPFDLRRGAAPEAPPRLGVWMPASSGYDARTEPARARARVARCSASASPCARRLADRSGAGGRWSRSATRSLGRRRSCASTCVAARDRHRVVAVRGPDGAWHGTRWRAAQVGACARCRRRGVAGRARGGAPRLSAASRRAAPRGAGRTRSAPALDDRERGCWAGDEARAAALRRRVAAACSARGASSGSRGPSSRPPARRPGRRLRAPALRPFAWAAREPFAEALPLAAAGRAGAPQRRRPALDAELPARPAPPPARGHEPRAGAARASAWCACT